jgi:hypothetical protein
MKWGCEFVTMSQDVSVCGADDIAGRCVIAPLIARGEVGHHLHDHVRPHLAPHLLMMGTRDWRPRDLFVRQTDGSERT